MESQMLFGHNLLLGALVFSYYGLVGSDLMVVLNLHGWDDSAAASAVVMVTNIAAAAGAVGAMVVLD